MVYIGVLNATFLTLVLVFVVHILCLVSGMIELQIYLKKKKKKKEKKKNVNYVFNLIFRGGFDSKPYSFKSSIKP